MDMRTYQWTDGHLQHFPSIHLSEITALEERQSYDGTVCNKDSMIFLSKHYRIPWPQNYLPFELKNLHCEAAIHGQLRSKAKKPLSKTNKKPHRSIEYFFFFFCFYSSIICTFWYKNQSHLCDLNCMLIRLLHEYVALHTV